MKKIFTISLCILLMCGCSGKEDKTAETNIVNSIVSWDEEDLNSDYHDEDVQEITLDKDTIHYEGDGASITDTTITISKAGTYKVSGTLEDGSIIVNASSESLIRIVFDDAHITCSDSAPIYIQQADKVILTLAEDSENTLTDGASYTLQDAAVAEPNAAIFSKDDLTINGNGCLHVTANYNNGIQSKDDLKIVSGNIDITSKDDGLVGKDLLAIKDGSIFISSGGDGMKTTNEEDSEKGNLALEGGTIKIEAQTDGVQAANGLYIYAGDFTITSGGGSINSSKQDTMMNGNPWGDWNATTTEDTASAKGLKSVHLMEIQNGSFIFDTSDDAIHTNGTLTISDGTFTIKSGDDGIHADTSLTISGGDIRIEESYEGIESSELYFTGGNIHIQASDDGLNAGGGNDESSVNGRPGQNEFTADTTKQIVIDDGYLYISANGDGIDSNGSVTMNGGTVIVNGPADSANGAMDFNGGFAIHGGSLIAVGSSGMLQSPTEAANGNCVIIGLNTASDSLIHIQDTEGNTVLTFQPEKTAQTLIFYSEKLTAGSTYEIYTGGSIDGDGIDGVYEDAAYQDGTLYNTFTIENTITTVGSLQGGMNGTMPGNPQDMQPPNGQMQRP